MSGLGDLFGKNSTAEQLFVWGILNQLISAAVGPGVQEISNTVNGFAPLVPLDPSILAGAVIKGLIEAGNAQSEAAKNGIDQNNFTILTQLAVNPPDIGALVSGLQRGEVDLGEPGALGTTFYGALTLAGIPADWQPLFKALATQLPSGAEVLNALLEGQIGEVEAQTRWVQAGMDPTWFESAFNANGEAPTPVQALEMWNRGIIPEDGTGPAAVSYEQAFLEGPWRNKWLDSFKALRIYYPPPRTVTAMYHQGQLNHDQASGYLAKQGLPADLVTAYLSKSTSSATVADKILAKGDVVSLYKDKLITHDVAIAHLVALKYSADDAALILEIADLASVKSALTAGVARVRVLYLAHKVTETDAEASLVSLGVTKEQATQIIDTWALTSVQITKTLTASEIVAAWYYVVIPTDEAITQLEALGYETDDAWVLLSTRAKGAIVGSPLPNVTPWVEKAPGK